MKIADIRSKLAAAEVPTIDKTFSPGITLTIKRVSLPTLVACGILPEHFYREMTKAQENGDEEQLRQALQERFRLMTDDERMAATLFTPRMVVMAVHSPKIVLGEAGEGELSLLEIPEETQKEIVGWVLAGCPGIGVQITGGEVEVKDLDRFRQKQPGGKPFVVEPDGAEVRDEAQRLIGLAG